MIRVRSTAALYGLSRSGAPLVGRTVVFLACRHFVAIYSGAAYSEDAILIGLGSRDDSNRGAYRAIGVNF
jgi:hypothetical protein